jgi:putative phosphoesterase
MARLAVLSDIHGNRWALEAVLEEIGRQAPDRYVVLGDLAADGPDPVGTLALLQSLPDAVFVRGNTDRFLGDLGALGPPEREWAGLYATWQWAADCLGDEGRRFLAGLPTDAVLETPAGPVLATHALPGQDDRWFSPGSAEELEGVDWHGARVLLVGHSHIPFVVQSSGGTAINPGSVGLSPQTGWRASYARVDVFPGGQVAVQHAQVQWDVEAYLAAFEDGIPKNDKSAPMLGALRRLIRS